MTYKPYPIDKVSELEGLCQKRAHVTGARRASLKQRITALSTELEEYGGAHEGDVVAGVRLVEVIDRGEFGTVWRAITSEGEDRAVKLIHPYRLGEGQMLKRFRRGVAAMRLLSGTSPPDSIIRWRESEDADLAFSMDYIVGGDLRELRSRRWSLERRLDVFCQVCGAVGHAHRHGVVHRDIKPANILIDGEDCPVLTDFDLADLVKLGAMTVDGRGTPRYAAPEQLDPPPEGQEVVRLRESDLYSLGKMLFYLVTQVEPSYRLSSSEVPEGDFKEYPGLRRIIAKCIQDDPAQRYEATDALLKDMEIWKARPEAVGVTPGQSIPRHSLVPVPDLDVSKSTSWKIATSIILPLLVIAGTVTAAMIQAEGSRDAARIQFSAPPAKAQEEEPPTSPPSDSPKPDPLPQPRAIKQDDQLEQTPTPTATHQREQLWLEKGRGKRDNEEETMLLRDSRIQLPPGRVLIGQFECVLEFNESGDPKALSACVGRGDVRTVEPLRVAVECVIHKSRTWTGCTSSPFSYSNGRDTKRAKFWMSVSHQ